MDANFCVRAWRHKKWRRWGGYYIAPTVIEASNHECDINRTELFGPVVTIQVVQDLEEALEMANSSDFGLTAAIHTKSVDRALWFAHRIKTG